jgi:sugar lactone lactonase YvrE
LSPPITPLSLSGDGIITTVAGDGTAGYEGDGGLATSAGLYYPSCVAVDASGNIYIADSSNHRIRLVTKSTGIITTVAGDGTPGYKVDGGLATSASLYYPYGVAVDASGNIYIADTGNNRIRLVAKNTGIITAVAGDGTRGYNGDGGLATSTNFNNPWDVAVDASGNIYIADSSNHRIRLVTKSTGIITTVAGDGATGYTGDGGLATSASLYYPYGIAVDASENIYIADSSNNRIRLVTKSTGIITTVAGDGTPGYKGDGGLAISAGFSYPRGIAVDASGNIYIADVFINRIRLVTKSTSIITTVAGDGTQGYKGDGGPATSSGLSSPHNVAVDASGNIYIADTINSRIRLVTPKAPAVSLAPSVSPLSLSFSAAPTALVRDPNAPSSRLSSAPSVPPQPVSPTSSPTTMRVVPSINSVAVKDISSNSVNLAVKLAYRSVMGVDTGGSLYCVALSNGAPTSVGAIKSAVRDGSMYRGAITSIPIATSNSVAVSLNMTISGLEAVHQYRIYCYAETSGGEGNTLSEVLLTETAAKTACCILVAFTNAPPYVYSDVTRYNTSSRDLFVFSYSLPRAPTGALHVNYTVTVRGANRKDILAVPSSSTFTSKSLLTGRFYLFSPIPQSVNCTVSLLFTGTQASNYASNGVRVMMMPPNLLHPAPSMVSCQFSDSGHSISVRFDSPTDEAPSSGASWACDQLFIFDGASLSTCVWLDSKTVRISFPVVDDVRGAVKLVIPSDPVTLKGKKLRAFCALSADLCSANPTAGQQTLKTSAPSNPLAPTVVVTAPSTLGSCLNLTLDAAGSYGNGGRLYSSVKWSVTAATFGSSAAALNAESLESYLNKLSDLYQVQRPITVPRSSLASATYTITLTLTNYMGLKSSSAVDIDVIIDFTKPSLTLIGASYQTTLASSPLSLHSDTSMSGCASTTALTYSWAVQLNGVSTGFSSVSPDPTTFSLPPYTLTADKTYSVKLTTSAGISSSSATVSMYVPHGDVTAAVLGGDARSVPIDSDLLLDASVSTDADVSPNAPSALLYKVMLPRCCGGLGF